MAEKFEIEIQAKVDQAVRSLDRVESKLKSVEGATGEAGDAADQGSESWATYAAGVGGAIVAVTAIVGQLRSVVSTVSDLAAEMERQAGVMNRFTGDISEARERTRGLTSDIDLMIASNRAAAAGLDLTAREFANVAAVANELGAALGEDATGAMNSLISAIATGRQGQLRKLGIDLTGITGLQNQQAEALRQLEEKYGDVAASADTFGGSLLSLGTQLDNLETELIANVTQSDLLDRQFKSMEQSVLRLNEALGGTTSGMGLIDQAFAGVNTAIAFGLQQIELFSNAFQALIDGDFIRAAQLAAQAIAPGSQLQRAQDLRDQAVGEVSQGTGGNRVFDPEGEDPRSGGGRGAGRDRGAEQELAALLGFGDALPGGGEDFDVGEFRNNQILSDLKDSLAEAAAIEEDRLKTQMSIAGQRESELRHIQEAAAAEQQALDVARERLQVMGQIGGLGVQALELFGANEGQKNLWLGATEVAKSIGSYPDFFGVAQHALAASLHFKAAADMGVGGGDRGRAAASPRSTPAAFAPSPQGANGGGGGGPTVINFNAPLDEALIGRAQQRADRAAARRFGGRA